MQFFPLKIPDVVLITPHVFEDARGHFFETWQAKKFSAAGIDAEFVQDNHSLSVRNTIRGLHYQIKHPQGKLVRILRGIAFDVAVDLRKSSPTFGQWVGVELSDQNRQLLWIPPGFAHGYLARSEQVDFLYKCTGYWDAEDERAIRWNDPEIGIEWSISSGDDPLLSPKDRVAPMFKEAEYYV